MLDLLVHASLEGAVLAACVWLFCRALPRMSPGVRALLWWCVAAKFVVALVWVTPIAVPVLPSATVEAPSTPPSASSPAAVDASRPVSPPARGSDAPEIPWTAILVAGWALGVGISLLRTLRDWRRTRGVVARSLPAGDGLLAMTRDLSSRLARRRTVDVRVSAEIESPLIVGVRRPVILVPADAFAALPAEQQRMALCHELAHLHRGDLWLGCVPALAERCFFFHPLARLAAREYAFWREAACDEFVLTTLAASPPSYARMLLALGVSRRTATFSAAGAAWSFQNLKRRITMLESTSSSSLRGRALAAGAVAVAILAIAPVRAVARSAAASLRPQVATPAPSPRSASPVAGSTAQATPAPTIAEPAAPSVAKTDDRQSQELSFVLLRADGNSIMEGSTADAERARRQRRSDETLLWFRYGGREYVVRDAAVLREVEELWGPVGEIGEEQGRIGEKQGAIGEEQGRLGAKQGEIGARQGRIGERQGAVGLRIAALALQEAGGASASERRAIERERAGLETEMRQLHAQMEALNQEMREFEGPMRDRGREIDSFRPEMERLGAQMETASERARAGMRTLVRGSIESGAAVTIR
ncbi:MAG TPA: M56 family metallopeptidase [Longimicrobium sp.]|jgi:beta-lactamase regulating signal transducer with metallopeptidase domain/cell division protein FtsB